MIGLVQSLAIASLVAMFSSQTPKSPDHVAENASRGHFQLSRQKGSANGILLPLKIARCTIEHNEESWLNAFLTKSSAGQKGEDTVIWCVRTNRLPGVNFHAILWGGALSEVLYGRLFPVPVNLNQLNFESFSTGSDDRGQRLYRFADCVVLREHEAVHRLLEFAPGSENEAAALVALVSENEDCVVDDKDVKSNIATLRAALAKLLFMRSLPVDEDGNFVDPRKLPNA